MAILAVVLFTVSMDASPTINELNQRRTAINNELAENRRELEAVRQERADAVREIELLNEEMRIISEDMMAIEDEIRSMQALLEETEIELDIAIELLENQYEMFIDRAVHMYMHGRTSYLDVLLNAESFTDLIRIIHSINMIIEHEQNMIDELIAAEQAVSNKIAQIEQQKEDLELVRDMYAERMIELEESMDAVAILVEELEESETEYLLVIATFENQASEVGRAIERAQAEQRAREAQAAANRAAQQNFVFTGGQFDWPVPGHTRISSGYVNRISPINGRREFHSGIDIPAPRGTNIVAAYPGVVIHSGWMGGFGNTIMIDHGGGIVTLYGHNSSNIARVGQQVARGEVIARVGSTGWSTGNHLHFEVRRNGNHTDPIPFLRG